MHSGLRINGTTAMSRNANGKLWTTPVLILNCKIGALGIMRTLGSLGTDIYGVEDDKSSPALKSRYLKKYFIAKLDPMHPQSYLEFVLGLSKVIGQKAVLIPTSDHLSLFVAEYKEQLKKNFFFSDNSIELLDKLSDKQKMFELAVNADIPTPGIIIPKKLDDVKSSIPALNFPLMLKAIDGNRLFERTGLKMKIIENAEELISNYIKLEDPDEPNLMLQELIPGNDDQVYIFNGYFDNNSDCLAAFTGYKVRQFPIHIGCASLGECLWNQKVADKTIAFMKAVGYSGILDIGYRLDPRDGRYKVLDINPRVGQAFRMFVAQNNMDVIQSLYLDLTGQQQPEIIPRENRRWIIEDYDFVSSFHYYKEGSLKIAEWLASFKNIEEGAWFSWRELRPFLVVMKRLVFKMVKWFFKAKP